jgi:hypothetical protein
MIGNNIFIACSDGNLQTIDLQLPLCGTMLMAYPDITMAELIVARDQQGAVRTKKYNWVITGFRLCTGKSPDFTQELK